MAPDFTLATAGNVLTPAYLTLQEKGLTVRVENAGAEGELWYAEDQHRRFIAEDPLSLLGLVAIHEVRGDDWHASDAEIEQFVAHYRT